MGDIYFDQNVLITYIANQMFMVRSRCQNVPEKVVNLKIL